MTTKRVKFSNIVQNQLPGYVKSDYPLVAEFLKSYYQGQEYQGGPIDLVSNIEQLDSIYSSETMQIIKPDYVPNDPRSVSYTHLTLPTKA